MVKAMIFNAYEHKEIAPFFEVLDLESGNFLQDVVIVNEDEGWYQAYARSDDGALFKDKNGNLMLQKFSGKIKLVYKGGL